jgi:hypothetical protein
MQLNTKIEDPSSFSHNPKPPLIEFTKNPKDQSRDFFHYASIFEIM